MRHAVILVTCGATENGCGNAAEQEKSLLTFRLWLRDLTRQPYLLCRRRRVRMREAWPLLQTPAVVFEQHTTPCLKISRVEYTIVVASHLCVHLTPSLSRCCMPPHHAACRLPNDLRGAGWLAGWHLASQHWRAGREDERGLRSPGNSSPCPSQDAPHCRALSHRGTMPELRGSRLGERNYLRKQDAAHGTRHPHTHIHSVSPHTGPRESDTFRAENHSLSVCTLCSGLGKP